METRFEVATNMEQKHWVEYYRFIWKKRFWTIAIFLVLGFVMLLLQCISEDFSGWLSFLICVTYCVWLYFRPWSAARKSVKLDQKFTDTADRCTITKFSDAMYDESKHESAMIPFDKIERIYIGKLVIVLIDVRKMSIIMDKNGFIKGTFEEFLPYIKEKCPQLKLPEW